MADIFISEFLYRGRSAGEPPAWHIILGARGQDAFGNPTLAERTLTMKQAKAEGWDLPKIIEAINRELLTECESLRSEREQQTAAIAALIEEKKALEATIAQLLKSVKSEKMSDK